MDAIIDRRIFFKIAATGVSGYFISPMQMFAQTITTGNATILGTAKKAIFILMPGAPSQTDTLDLKVGSWTPASFTPTTINGIDWPSGLLPNLATQFSANRFAVVRSCQSSALVHSLLQTWTQIARSPTSATGKIAPNIGSVVALEKEPERGPGQKIPGFVSLNGGGTLQGVGYLSSRFSPFDVAPAAGGLTNLTNSDGQGNFTNRYNILQTLDGSNATNSPFGTKFEQMADFYASARGMMYDTNVTNTFRFTADEQTRYGNSGFGNACVTARNLIATDLGVRYVQITIGGWDNHQNIYTNNGLLNPARQFDTGLANLINDLAMMPGSDGKSLLDETIIVAKGEFGRTVGNITSQAGRDHYFVHSALLAGGGIQGGRVIGSTNSTAMGSSAPGSFVDNPGWSAQRPVYAEDIAATVYSALGINYLTTRHDDPLGRGFEYIPTTGSYIGQPILELFQ
jgi:uncharacterized protein (DUF1501 family)